MVRLKFQMFWFHTLDLTGLAMAKKFRDLKNGEIFEFVGNDRSGHAIKLDDSACKTHEGFIQSVGPDEAIDEFKIELTREVDGRWIGEIPELPGVLVYADSKDEARQQATVLAFRVVEDEAVNGS